MTNQQHANHLLGIWQASRALPPEERLEVLMSEFFQPPPESDFIYEMTLRDVAFEMAA